MYRSVNEESGRVYANSVAAFKGQNVVLSFSQILLLSSISSCALGLTFFLKKNTALMRLLHQKMSAPLLFVVLTSLLS